MGETGKPGTNWKQVTPANKKKVSPLVRHYMKQAHPFTACVRDNTKRFGPDRAKRICAVVKDMGERSTKWRKGRVSEAPLTALEVEAIDVDGLVAEHWDEVIAPVLEAEGVTVDELADWSEMTVAAGVLEAVTFDDPAELATAADGARVQEAKKRGATMARGSRRGGESLTDFGKRMQAGDKRAQARRDRTGKAAGGDFEKKHPRGRGGEWKVSVDGQEADVEERDGNLHGASTKSKAAIRAFQKKHGLKVDGVIGKQTASALLGNKSARKVATGKLKADQRSKLKPKKKGRVRETPAVDVDEALEALAGVQFTPSELVDACR